MLAGRHPRITLRQRVEAVAAARQDLGRLVEPRDREVVGILLRPGDRARRADHPHPQAVVVTDRHLRGPVQPAGVALVIDEDRGVVVERTPRNERVEASAQSFDPEARQRSHHVFDVGADVADAERLSRLLRVGPPGGLFVNAVALQRRGQPLLRVFGVHEAELAEIAAGDHLPGMLHGGISRIGVGHAEEEILAARQSGQLLRLSQLYGERLVAHDVNAT